MFFSTPLNRRTCVLAAARRSPPHVCGGRRQSEFRCSSLSARLISCWKPPDTSGVTGMWKKSHELLLQSGSFHLYLDACSWLCAEHLLQQWDGLGVSQFSASGQPLSQPRISLWGGGPTHRNVAFQLYFKIFGFLSADLAEWLDFTRGRVDNKEAVCSHHTVLWWLHTCVYQSIKKGHRELKL